MAAPLYKAPALKSLNAYDPNITGKYEAVKASLYDFQTYAITGHSQMAFFQVPVGQSSKTLEDTNMETAGTLPTPKHFLVQTIELFAFSSLNPATLGAAAAQEQINDIYDFSKAGYLDFYIGSKSYLTEAPLGRFPPKNGLVVSAAMSDASTAAAGLNNRIAYANLGGRPYELAPPILLKPTQNFKVTLNWATLAPVSATIRVGVVLGGILYRQAQ